jgi:hypothetical protein
MIEKKNSGRLAMFVLPFANIGLPEQACRHYLRQGMDSSGQAAGLEVYS